MDKKELLKKIISTLESDLSTLIEAAKTAHEASTHEECAPENKYDTTALEASYVAQGQANRAQEIRESLAMYQQLELRLFDKDAPIRLTALVTIEAEDGHSKQIFLGPGSGGLKLAVGSHEATIITPDSPLGRVLLGKCCDDEIQVGPGAEAKTFTITDIS